MSAENDYKENNPLSYEEAYEILSEHQKWRRGEDKYAWNEDPTKDMAMPYSPTQIGWAIDKALVLLRIQVEQINFLQKMFKEPPDLPTKECPAYHHD